MIEYLLKNGANIEARGEINETPLMESISSGNIEAVTLLLQNGADHKVKNDFDQTVLDIAQKIGHEDIIKCIELFSELNASKHLL